MKRLLLVVATLLTVSACTSVDEASRAVEAYGFTITSKTDNLINVKFGVTFGDGGCAGDLYYGDASASKLNARIPTNGTIVEVDVDNPRVLNLRENKAFAPCFSNKATGSDTASVAPTTPAR